MMMVEVKVRRGTPEELSTQKEVCGGVYMVRCTCSYKNIHQALNCVCVCVRERERERDGKERESELLQT